MKKEHIKDPRTFSDYYYDLIWHRNPYEKTTGIVEFSCGAILHLKNGLNHNENGPCILHKNGTTIYSIDGIHHRIDGPAYTRIEKESIKELAWYVNNCQINRWSPGSSSLPVLNQISIFETADYPSVNNMVKYWHFDTNISEILIIDSFPTKEESKLICVKVLTTDIMGYLFLLPSMFDVLNQKSPLKELIRNYL